VGLAVHSHLWCCTRCEFVAFLTVRKSDSVVERGSAAPQTGWQGVRRRIAGLLRPERR
jgi:hypothetical protein